MRPVSLICGLFVLFLFVGTAQAQKIEYLTPTPLVERIQVQAQPVQDSGEIPLWLIAWGGDVGTVHANLAGTFQKYGFNFKLEAQDYFPKQVESCLRGETPYLRGTADMIAEAEEVFARQGIHLQTVVQLTWSVGGDVMTVRQHVKSLKDVKKLALQLDGPHMYYADYLLKSGGASRVQFKWLKELTLPKYDTGGKIVDPVSAFQADSDLDAVMCISPDADMLTSGGKIGTGSENSVKGARKYVTSKDTPKLIADLYVVRSDYAATNLEKVKNFQKAIIEGQAAWVGLMKSKSANLTKYQQTISKSAELLMGSATATNDVEGMIGDCQYVGAEGNVAFFTGRGTTRTLTTLSSEINSSLKGMGLLTSTVTIAGPNWDVAAFLGLPAGSAVTQSVAATAPRFDQRKAAATIERRIEAEPAKWEEEGTLFVKEIFFAPDQNEFTEVQYAEDFMEAMKKIDAYGGALVAIEGHSDPTGVWKAKKKANETKSPMDIAIAAQIEQRVKNLSSERAEAVKKSFLAFCKKRGLKLDESQFVTVGMGIRSPKFSPPRTQEEWAANRRCVFRIKGVAAEASEFEPTEAVK